MKHTQVRNGFATLLLAACGATPPASVPAPQVLPAVIASDPSSQSNPVAAKKLPAAIERIHHVALHESRALELARSLTDDAGPRLTGSQGDKRAVAWGLRTMTALGFSNVRAEKVMAPHWVRGTESAEVVAPIAHRLSVTALGRGIATGPNGVTAEVLEVESLDALKKLDDTAARGKIVFANVPMTRARDGHGYGDVVGVRWLGAHLAAKAGAVAFVLRSCGTDHDRMPHTGAKSPEKPDVPAGALSVPDAELLHRLLQEHKSVSLQLTLTPKTLPDVETANVVGEVLGSEKPNEIVMLGAHLDSWDLGTGAIDDAAGVGIVLEVARVIGLGAHPRRTVRVVLFANEESGGAGSKAYARAAGEAAKHVVSIEADFGGDRAYEFRVLGGPDARAKLGGLADALAPLSVKMVDHDADGGADLQPLRALGVPVVDVRQDGTRYFDLHHTANDTIDKIDHDAIAQASAAFATVAYTIADLESDLGRIPVAKHKSLEWTSRTPR